MLKEIVDFIDENPSVENYFLQKDFKSTYLINHKDEVFLSILDSKSKNEKYLKIQKQKKSDLTIKEFEKILFLENNSKALPRKQLNKDKGSGGAGVFLFSFLYYEYIDNEILIYRKKEDKNIQVKDWKKKLISPTMGILNQLETSKKYFENKNFYKVLEYIENKNIGLISRNIENLKYAIENKLIASKGDLKNLFFVSNKTISIFRKYYLKRKVFIYDMENNKDKFINSICHICKREDKLSSPAFLSNYGVEFSTKIDLKINFNQMVCSNCAMKLEKFRYMTENKLTNPFPLFLDKKNLFVRHISLFNNDEKRKNFREIIKSIYFSNPKDLKNYYLLNYKMILSSGTKKLEVKDLDYIENFEYMTSFKIINFMDLRNSFILDDFYIKSLSVFQFEKVINDLVFEYNMQKNYFKSIKKSKKDTEGFMIYYKKYNEKKGKLEDSENKNSKLLNYLFKYRQNFYDFIYKSHKTRLDDIEFREMLIDLIIDNIRHDELNKNGYSIYENQICEKLNLLFSWNKWKNKEGEDMKENVIDELKNKMKKNLGYWDSSKKEFIGGIDYLKENDNKFFFFLCGQLSRYLLSKKKGDNKSHRDFYGFLEWQNSKLLKEYIEQIFAKYSHDLKYKSYNGKFENAMGIIITYDNNINVEDYKEYMISGYFTDNYFLSNQENEIKGESDE